MEQRKGGGVKERLEFWGHGVMCYKDGIESWFSVAELDILEEYRESAIAPGEECFG